MHARRAEKERERGRKRDIVTMESIDRGSRKTISRLRFLGFAAFYFRAIMSLLRRIIRHITAE